MSTPSTSESPGFAADSSASNTPSATSHSLARIERKLTWLTVGVFGVAVALLFNVAAVYGTIIEFHAGEGLLVGSASAGGVAMGFVFGWLARRAIV
ncbi:MAG: hypothetical protein AB7U73_17675 [Pirellulales bacterium]